MSNVALLDLVRPFIVRGENLGGMHAALAVLRVVEYDVATDANATVIRGRCEFNGALRFDNSNGLSIGADETAPVFDPNQRKSVFDIRETSVGFELVAPRVGSALIAEGVAGLPAAGGTQGTRDVLDALAATPPGTSPGDYPATGFTLDLLLDAPRLRPPFLRPARLSELGTLAPDPTRAEVSFTLPKLRFRVSHGGPGLRIELVSAGATSLDDPGDIGVAELVSMDPPYAFFGTDADSRAWGMALRSITLDLSGDTTPAALRDKTGIGDDWTGLYLPDARVFFSPTGERGLAFDIGARELLIGIGETPGLWGDFEAALIQQGADNLAISARFADKEGKLYGIEKTGEFTAKARIPAKARMLVDVTGGRPPYTVKATVGDAAQATGRVFIVDFGALDTLQIFIEASSPGTDGTRTRKLTITAESIAETPRIETPGPQAAPEIPIELGAAAGELRIVKDRDTQGGVVLRTEEGLEDVWWSIDDGGGGTETGPQRAFTVPVAAGQNLTVRARRSPPKTLEPFYFLYGEPRKKASAPYDIKTSPADSTAPAGRMPNPRPSLDACEPILKSLASTSTQAPIKITIVGHASKEEKSDRKFNYELAGRRAKAVRETITQADFFKQFDENKFKIVVHPDPEANPALELDTETGWIDITKWGVASGSEARKEWRAEVTVDAVIPDITGSIALHRAPEPPPPDKPPPDPQPEAPKPPSWFRSASLKLRVVASEIIAGEATLEIDMEMVAEKSLRESGALPADAQAPSGRALVQGSAVGPDNPADGITKFRILVQSDPATGKLTTLVSAGADPADKNGLYTFGWMPGEPGAPTEANPESAKDFPRTLLGSYLTFWPILAEFPFDEMKPGEVVDVALSGAALAVPAGIAALDWFQVERVVWYGVEFEGSWRNVAGNVSFDGRILVDVETDWSADFIGLVKIMPNSPLKVRYKAIGLRFGDTGDDGSEEFVFRPVFDSSRGYTIDLSGGGAPQLIDPLGKILRILGARLSKSNPLTFEMEIGLGVDLGVVRVDRAGLRVYLDESRPAELTSLAASVDIPGALVGSGYVKIGKTKNGQGEDISVIGGQLDLTLRPISLRVSAALAIAQIPEEAGGPATGVYVGLDVVLPVGLPLGTSGLGIFGFRGIFGMHYERKPVDVANSNVPALDWLRQAGGRPHLLANGGVELWRPAADRWSFGIGILIGTMEGGYLINLDGTFLLELPGPRVIIMLNARLLEIPPDVGKDEVGMTAGLLAVIEITPEHFLIGVTMEWGIEDLISIRIPMEAVFPFGADKDKWHIYLGSRTPPPGPVTVDVLGIVEGTGYLMFEGDGLPAYVTDRVSLPAISGFAIGLGVGASFTWGDVDSGLYLMVGGGMDAVVGFKPFTLAGTIWVAGELRLWIVSIGADAKLDAIVQEQEGGEMMFSARGEACGHVDFFFFEVSGCVSISIGSEPPASRVPDLVEKVSLRSRSPALVQGTGVDRGVDVSLGDATASPGDALLPVVPIDSVPVIAMAMPPVMPSGFTVTGIAGAHVGPAPGLPGTPDPGYAERSGERYRYEIEEITLERIDPATSTPIAPAVTGATAPTVWWSTRPDTEPAPAVQLALFTWDPVPATKAIEKTEHLVEEIVDRWGTVCAPVAAPAEVLWTFRFEELGPSASGWEVDGIAWPDEPDTVRTAPPETGVVVTERWRSGDMQLDGLRGIIPAVVVGAPIPCRRRKPPVVDLDDLVADRPLVVVGGRGAIDSRRPSGQPLAADEPAFAGLVRGSAQEPIRVSSRLVEKARRAAASEEELRVAVSASAQAGLDSVLARFDRGEAVGRISQIAASSVLRPEVDARRAAFLCTGKVLQAPVLDDGRLIAIGDRSYEKDVAQRLEALGLKHGELDDVVVLHTGGFASLDVLLLAHRKFEERWPIVRVVGPGDATLDRFQLDASHVLSSVAGLPQRWTDPAGPWTDDVGDAIAYGAAAGLAPLFIHLKDYKDAVAVEIGRRPGIQKEDLVPAYWVAAFSTVSMAEVARHDWDETQHQVDRSILTDFVGPAATDNVLLVPDSLYRLSVAYKGVRKSDGKTTGQGANQKVTQTFWFRTDRIADGPAPGPENMPSIPAEPIAQDDVPALHFAGTRPAPVRLDPWLLTTLPAQGESHVFTTPTVKLVFATADVERLFAAYGKRLQVRIEASSGRHPKETDTGAAFPLSITPDLLTPISATVLSPFETALLEAAVVIDQRAGFCIPIDETRVRHQELDIPTHLERATGYILDVEVVPDGSPAGTRGPRIFRRQFSTGMFADFDELAASLAATAETGRGGAAGAVAGIAARFVAHPPAGAEFDDAWRHAGFDPLGAARDPRITVVWEQPDPASPPQPTGILVESPAPLTRSRPYPQSIEDPPATRWALREETWLEVQDVSGTAAVKSIIRSPGADRYLVVLNPDQRGVRVDLDLVEKAFPDRPFLNQVERRARIVSAPLDHAPWEEI